MKLRLVKNSGENGFSYDIDGDIISVGRSETNDIQIHDERVSRNHLLVWKKGYRYFLKDLGSGNGTFVNSHRIPSGATVEVKEWSDVLVGTSVLCFGRGSSGDMFAFLDAAEFSKQSGSGGGTVIIADTVMPT